MTLDKRVKILYKKINQFGHKLSASIFDYFSNIMTVITLRLKKTVRKKIDEKIQVAYEDYKKAAYMLEVKWGLASIAVRVMTVIILMYRAYTDFHTTGIILIGTLFMLYSYLERVGKAFFKFAQFYGTMTKKAADIESAEPIDKAFASLEPQLKSTLPKNWKQIQIKNLNFTYNQEGDIQHLSNIDFSFKRGE